MKFISKNRLDDEREISILGKPIIHYFKRKFSRSKNCYLSFFPRQSLQERLGDILEFHGDNLSYELEYLERRFSKYDFDDAYLFASASGETFFTMQYFNQICEQMGSKKPLLLSNKAYGTTIFKMFHPKIEAIKHFSILFDLVEPMTPLTINNHRYIFPFTKSYFSILEDKHRAGEDCHFFENLTNHFRIDPSRRCLAIITKETQDKINEFIKLKGLFDNFIIISKHAASNDTLSQYFWEELEYQVRQLGFNVFLNNVDCGINLEEFRYLASKSKGVIGVRSGALDLCADVAPMTIAYYLPFTRRGDWAPIRSSSVMKNFSLKKLPGCSCRIHEFDICEIGENRAMDLTLELLTIK